MLCANCLEPASRQVPVGPDQGSQRDPWQKTLLLCTKCEEALVTGDLPGFHARYASERTIRR